MSGGSHKKRRNSKVTSPNSKQRDNDSIRLTTHINELLDAQDVKGLRRVAAVRGLVNSQLRSRCWPLLVGADPTTVDVGEYQELSSQAHRDSSVVKCDVQRSLWTYTRELSDEEREAKRQALQRLLNAVVNYHSGSVFYYQGLHDVASVLLMVVGEPIAFVILTRIGVGHLRDCSRQTLDAVVEVLGLLEPLLKSTDPQLARFLQDSQLPPFFALSWFITWFSHDVKMLPDAARLFDLFLSSHPLMPLYVAAAAMRSSRAELLECGEMPSLHTALVNLDITRHLSVDQLAQEAIKLFKASPPQRLVQWQRQRLVVSVAAEARLDGEVWSVPQKATGTAGAGRTPVGVLSQLGSLLRGGLLRRKRVAMLTTALSVTSLCTVYALGMWIQYQNAAKGQGAALPGAMM